MQTKNLSTLKIHKLTQAQYDRELEAGRIDENALYLTPDDGTSGGGVGGDTLPVGAEVIIDSNATIPAGWEEVEELYDANEVYLQDGRTVQNAITNIETICNPNLLINSDFRTNWTTTVNQRGQSSYSANDWNKKYYTIDRWYIFGAGTQLTCHTDFIRIENTSAGDVYFGQTFEQALPLGTYTLSCSVANISGTVSISHGIGANIPLSKGMNITDAVYGQISSVAIVLGANSSIDIEYIKLEQGSIATPLAPQDFGQELVKCQRYYWKRPAKLEIFAGYINDAATGAFIGTLPLPNAMRVAPTVTISRLNGIYVLYGTEYHSANSFESLLYNANADSTITLFFLTSIRAIQPVIGVIAEDVKIELDAEIY